MTDKAEVTPQRDLPPVTEENADLARLVFGAYQAYADKPAAIEMSARSDGTPDILVFGMVNPCRFGDQCEGHSCYCNHPAGPRKCRHSWYTGGAEPDSACPLFEANPYWREAENGDFYDSRELTLRYMEEEGLVERQESEEGA